MAHFRMRLTSNNRESASKEEMVQISNGGGGVRLIGCHPLVVECIKNNYEIQMRVIRFPGLFNPIEYKTGWITFTGPG